MTPVALVDNDILQKFGCYGLMPELEATIVQGGSVGILGAARYVVRRVLKRFEGAGAIELQAAFENFLQRAISLEPSEEEIALATEMEEIANRKSLGFDSGESQLCAIAIVRGIGAVVTGDKRGIEALEEIREEVPSLVSLLGAIICLEQVMLSVANVFGYARIRSHVCALREVDTAVSICLRCWNPGIPEDESFRSAFESYIDDLRSRAPSMLCGGYALSSS